MKNLLTIRTIILALLILFLGKLSFSIFSTSKEFREKKEDLIELSSIKYGLFNVDSWKKLITKSAVNKIETFELSAEDREILKVRIHNFLVDEIDSFEVRYKRDNGFLRNLGSELFGIFDELKQQAPEITESILEFIEKSENKDQLEEYFSGMIEDYSEETFSEMDYSAYEAIISKYGFPDESTTKQALTNHLTELSKSLNTLKYLTLINALLVLGIFFIFPLKIELTALDLSLFLFICLIYLILGIYQPVLEIDARISHFGFTFFGDYVSFENQVIYYNSRGILGVVEVLLQEESFDILAVGILLLSFSILFPLSKLISSFILIFFPKQRGNKFLTILVYRTGKWSMADVMVVAIFMSYIGFSGIISSQLNDIEKISSKAEILTTNNSALQIGFFMFTTFVVLSLLLTTKLKEFLEKQG